MQKEIDDEFWNEVHEIYRHQIIGAENGLNNNEDIHVYDYVQYMESNILGCDGIQIFALLLTIYKIKKMVFIKKHLT